jgi:hypothetical protein
MKLLIVALLLTLGLSEVQAQSVTFKIEVSAGDTPEKLILAGGTRDTDLNAEFDDDGVATVSLSTGAYRSQPRTLLLQWQDGEREDFPVFLLPELAGQTVQMLFVGSAFGPADQAAADRLCRDTRPVDLASAFQMVFGCRQWAEGLERGRREFSKEHLRAVNGWVIGNNFLFRLLPEAGNAVIGPFGFQEALIERLKRILVLVDRDGRPEHQLSPLNIADLRRVLLEHEQQALRLAGRLRVLVDAEQLTSAKDLFEVLEGTYDRQIASAGERSVYKVDGGAWEPYANVLAAVP